MDAGPTRGARRKLTIAMENLRPGQMYSFSYPPRGLKQTVTVLQIYRVWDPPVLDRKTKLNFVIFERIKGYVLKQKRIAVHRSEISYENILLSRNLYTYATADAKTTMHRVHVHLWRIRCWIFINFVRGR